MGTSISGVGTPNTFMAGEPDLPSVIDGVSGRTQAVSDGAAQASGADAPEQKRTRPSEATLDKWILDVEDQLQRRDAYLLNEDMRRAPLGLWSLDSAMAGGIRPGEVFGLMARPGIGKTLTMCNIMRHWGERCSDRLQICFSLEMPAAQIILRNTQLVYGLTKEEATDAIKDGLMNSNEYRRVFGNLVLVDRPGLDIEQMAAVIRGVEKMMRKPVGMFAIDYLGLIGGNRTLGRYERVSQNAIDIKELARTFDIAGVLLVQVNRDRGGDGTRPIGLGAARDSGVVEEAADYMAGIWRESEVGPDLGMALLKNRHGALVNHFTVRFNTKTLELTDEP